MKRISVTFIDKAVFALAELRVLTNLSQADIVNRAVQLYLMWEKDTHAGYEMLRRAPDGTVEKIQVL